MNQHDTLQYEDVELQSATDSCALSFDSLAVLLEEALKFQKFTIMAYALNAWSDDRDLEEYRALLVKINTCKRTVEFLEAQQAHYEQLKEAIREKNPELLRKISPVWPTPEGESKETLLSETTYHALQKGDDKAAALDEQLTTEEEERQQRITTLSAEKENLAKTLANLANTLNQTKQAFFTREIKAEFGGKTRAVAQDFSFIAVFSLPGKEEAVIHPTEKEVEEFLQTQVIANLPFHTTAEIILDEDFEALLLKLWNKLGETPHQPEVRKRIVSILLRAGFNPFNQQKAKNGATYFPIDNWLYGIQQSPQGTTDTAAFTESSETMFHTILQNAPHIGILDALAGEQWQKANKEFETFYTKLKKCVSRDENFFCRLLGFSAESPSSPPRNDRRSQRTLLVSHTLDSFYRLLYSCDLRTTKESLSQLINDYNQFLTGTEEAYGPVWRFFADILPFNLGLQSAKKLTDLLGKLDKQLNVVQKEGTLITIPEGILYTRPTDAPLTHEDKSFKALLEETKNQLQAEREANTAHRNTIQEQGSVMQAQMNTIEDRDNTIQRLRARFYVLACCKDVNSPYLQQLLDSIGASPQQASQQLWREAQDAAQNPTAFLPNDHTITPEELLQPEDAKALYRVMRGEFIHRGFCDEGTFLTDPPVSLPQPAARGESAASAVALRGTASPRLFQTVAVTATGVVQEADTPPLPTLLHS